MSDCSICKAPLGEGEDEFMGSHSFCRKVKTMVAQERVIELTEEAKTKDARIAELEAKLKHVGEMVDAAYKAGGFEEYSSEPIGCHVEKLRLRAETAEARVKALEGALLESKLPCVIVHKVKIVPYRKGGSFKHRSDFVDFVKEIRKHYSDDEITVLDPINGAVEPFHANDWLITNDTKSALEQKEGV